MIEELVIVVVGVGVGSVIGAYLNSKLLTRNILANLHKAAQSETLAATLNKRAEEIGASLARGARKEMRSRFDFLSIPELEEGDKPCQRT